MPRSESSGFGIMHIDDHGVIQSFLEKPADLPPMPGKPDKSLASMGIYISLILTFEAFCRQRAQMEGDVHSLVRPKSEGRNLGPLADKANLVLPYNYNDSETIGGNKVE